MSNEKKQDENTSPSQWWKPIDFGWKYMNYMLVGVALIVGFCVWALPNNWADPEVQAGMKRIAERQKLAKEWAIEKERRAAEEARIAAENEEMGLIYIDPGTNPFLPPESLRDQPAEGQQ